MTYSWCFHGVSMFFRAAWVCVGLSHSKLVNVRSISDYDQGYLLVYLLNIFLLTYALFRVLVT